jgi:hypothetical protein
MGNRSIPAILREDSRRESVEGETFSSNPAHPYWRVRVRFTTGLKPSMERIRAATASQALEFVLARYPFACRSGSKALGRWDAASAPIDHKAPVAKPAVSAKPLPAPQSTPAPAPPMTNPILGVTLKRLPRDPQGRAMIDPAILSDVAQAHENGLSWPTIAFQLGCDERNLRERVVKWRKQQEARVDAKQALEASVAKRRQAGGPVPDGVPVGGADPGREKLVPTDAPAAPPLTGASDAMDPRLWDVSGPSGQVLAIQQPSALSGRLMTVLAAAGVSCSRVVSPYQPTPPPVITPTKVGGFTVQVTVNPVGSGG